jgi:ppGpp synthetase/RelA/SpoT-type nucleotidyltranferase
MGVVKMMPPAEVGFERSRARTDVMAYATLQHTLDVVDAAGDFIIGEYPELEDDTDNAKKWETWDRMNESFAIINNWRAAHSFPLTTFQVGLKQRSHAIDPSSIAAQRIKRLSSIEIKLRRFAWLKLSAMQDIGGCRAVVSSVRDVQKLRKSYKESRIKHELIDSDDYIETPKKSGYRGVHLIYSYKSDKKETYNGRKIEMQLRTVLQHAWATAVETVGTFVRQALKSSQGEEEWLRFFALMGTALALREDSPPVPKTPATARELRSEIRHYAAQLEVEHRLQMYGHALKEATSGLKNAHYFLVALDPKEQKTTITGFTTAELDNAAQAYLKTERDTKKQGGDAVLVSVDSLASLKRAYPNYFLDTRVFLDAVREATK